MSPVVPLRTGGTDPVVAATVVVAVLVVVGLSFAYRMALLRSLGDGSDSPPPESKTNCPECGARVPADGDSCTYCGESMPGGA